MLFLSIRCESLAWEEPTVLLDSLVKPTDVAVEGEEEELGWSLSQHFD